MIEGERGRVNEIPAAAESRGARTARVEGAWANPWFVDSLGVTVVR